MYILYFCHVEFMYISMLKRYATCASTDSSVEKTYEPFEALVDFVDIQIVHKLEPAVVVIILLNSRLS